MALRPPLGFLVNEGDSHLRRVLGARFDPDQWFTRKVAPWLKRIFRLPVMVMSYHVHLRTPRCMSSAPVPREGLKQDREREKERASETRDRAKKRIMHTSDTERGLQFLCGPIHKRKNAEVCAWTEEALFSLFVGDVPSRGTGGGG